MLKKQLCMLILCTCLLQPFKTLATEKNISQIHSQGQVTRDVASTNNSSTLELDDDEDMFIESYCPPSPSKTEKLLSVLAPYIITLLPYYLYLSASVESMKSRAARCYKTAVQYAVASCHAHKKDV